MIYKLYRDPKWTIWMIYYLYNGSVINMLFSYGVCSIDLSEVKSVTRIGYQDEVKTCCNYSTLFLIGLRRVFIQ